MRRLALGAVAALALAGCGDELEQFRDDLRPLEAHAEDLRSRISGELRSLQLGSDAAARGLRVQTGELAATYEEIADLDAPEAYEKPFATYVRANAGLVGDLEEFAAELAAGDARGLRRAAGRVIEHLGQSQRARLRWLE